MTILPRDQEISRENPWDAFDPATGPDLDDEAAADLLFSAMVTDFDIAADLEDDPEYDAWLDRLQQAAESCQEDREAGLTLNFPTYLDRERQVRKTVDEIVDAILHIGSNLDWCPCYVCTLRRTTRYAGGEQNSGPTPY